MPMNMGDMNLVSRVLVDYIALFNAKASTGTKMIFVAKFCLVFRDIEYVLVGQTKLCDT